MSGHSKWSTIKRQKGLADAKRANIFTKLAKNLTVAARLGGGDPDFNFRLRVAIDQAKAANMPKDNIEKAIKRGTGELGGDQIEELYYEGFGPGQVAFIIKTLTDNKKRTVSELKHIFTKHGGSLGSPNSVSWMFDQKGVIRISKENLPEKPKDEIEMELIDQGPEDISWEEDSLKLVTKPAELQKVRENLEKINYPVDYAELEYLPKEKINITDTKPLEQLEKFYEALDEHEDVDNYYTNIEQYAQ